ncbi:hypothetical protein GCM10007301_56930 [Azorhizobium oxalatiphilum]|uniref:DUF2934 domain-containing protein n=1 Tax=Azorhizobium oxalatiphilum TaxID=980631 RepID=A0A917CIP3_9HYPH|nr:DUF2934 domain-containing protein [Azorhizobium oxalatiphilum]GGF89626.1 hypothetical protein GCM10007301_56930 [Azorhizobium oxalatiphilum]
MDIEDRIRERAHQIWLSEGQPQGRAQANWDMAKEIIAQEDGYLATTRPVSEDTVDAEPASLQDNLGEFPTLTDQGEGSPPAPPQTKK